MHYKHDSDNTHPNAYQEFGRFPRENEYFGFATAADLLRWFKGFIPDLLRAGFEIVELNQATITACDKYQVLFEF